MHVFIVRPFGTKEGIDFDEVENRIIAPALEGREATTWGTTGIIAEQGNIRADMMDRLLTADLVIADISIHNANVYYELGVRHALRHRPTILIRCSGHDVPFDLKTDRYLAYDLADPSGSAAKLRETIDATLQSQNADSPVYQLLPDLEPRDGAAYVSTPREFSEAVERARASGDRARLALLADEARSERWHLPGERLVGRALFKCNAMRPAMVVWERVREQRPDDVEANLLLGTIFQRRGDLPRSEQALARVLQGPAGAAARAEALALRGRNLKDRWKDAWKEEDDVPARQCAALRSDLLLQSFEAYRDGFLEDANHYFPGLNALALSVILTELARAHPEVWGARFEDEDMAELALRRHRRTRDKLAAAVEIALDAAQARGKRTGEVDDWLALSVADHRFLTSARASYVKQGYLDAAQRVSGFNPQSTALQLQIYVELGIRPAMSAAALEALGYPDGVPVTAAALAEHPRVIVSTGHRMDVPGRASPRFPLAMEDVARQAIADAVRKEQQAANGPVSGICGLASGNDILFHEVCQALGVPTVAGLALSRSDFMRRSVQDSEGEWVERYRALCNRLDPEELGESVPSWVSGVDDSYVFQRCNMWLLEQAFAQENAEVTLIALWNGAEGDGPGGTADMVQIARERGAKVVILDTRELFAGGD
jgi:hypothetical protein